LNVRRTSSPLEFSRRVSAGKHRRRIVPMAKPIVEMLIETATLELPDTKTITLRWPEGYEVDFRTGQFVTLCWPDDPQYKRAYSLSSCALDRGFF